LKLGSFKLEKGLKRNDFNEPHVQDYQRMSPSARRRGNAGTRRAFAAAVMAAAIAVPAAAQERPDGYTVFSCTHHPTMKVTQEMVAMYGDRGDKLVMASDLDTFLALVSMDSVARLRKDGQAYERFAPATKAGGKPAAPILLKYSLGKDQASGKQYLKVTRAADDSKVMDCTPVQK
jgi:hypothetical protein